MSSSLIVVLQPRHGLDRDGLDFAAFARHYSRYHFCFLFLRVLRCFSSPRSPRNLFRCPAFSRTGCPIRVSADQVVFANPRGFSQLITPFFASRSQGIRPAPFSTFSCPDFTTRSIRQRIPRQEVCGLRSVFSTVFSFFSFLLYPAGSSRVLHHPPPLREKGLSESLSRRQRFVHYVNDLFFALMTDFSIPFIRIFPWRMRGSNPRPPACKAGALSQLS